MVRNICTTSATCGCLSLLTAELVAIDFRELQGQAERVLPAYHYDHPSFLFSLSMIQNPSLIKYLFVH